MRNTGDKVTYCVTVLSARHGVCERKVYEIIGRFKKKLCITQYECAIFFVFMGE
ncbi:Mor transcription activator domain-containing protein [Bacteroides eggerthii]|uniref:Mor transcription activator domain-containing protein n=1 Tax=Bacteroides eggerthii TaxID=28111 RepID=A0A380YQR2_9BACE|nr:Mor transcription activator domain-containing protein [Bacteroides eggerthii]